MIHTFVNKTRHVLALSIGLLWGAKVYAVSYAPLSGPTLPGIKENPNLPDVLNAILGWSVGLAAILAVIMLAVGGFNYMTSESVFKTVDAKDRIFNAVVGLLIVLFAVFLLGFINPDIKIMSLSF